MSAIQAATGHDNAGALAEFVLEPRCVGLQWPEIRYATDGTKLRHGSAFAKLIWDYLTPTWFAAVLTQLGLSESVLSANVTVSLPHRGVFANYNAIAHLPETDTEYQPERGKYLNIVITLTELEALA
jgi:hypothetical protein